MIRVSGSQTSPDKLLCKHFYEGWFEIHVHGVRILHTWMINILKLIYLIEGMEDILFSNMSSRI